MMVATCINMIIVAAGVFVEEPQNATVVESSSATFRSNSLFSIFWLVNNSNAKYTIFQERGVTIVAINDTSSQLIVVGYKNNNNTLMNCAAMKYQNYQLVAWIPSESALLVVMGKVLFDVDCIFSRVDR